MSRRSPQDRVVYSSDRGRVCPVCAQPQSRCRCARSTDRETPRPSGDVRVGRASKGRKGKPVTTVSGLPLRDNELAELASELKRLCGSGGTVREGTIEIQGEHRDRVLEELAKRGFRAKRSGG